MIVISLGGSALRPTENFDIKFMKSICSILKSRISISSNIGKNSKNNKFVIIVGGGHMARIKANQTREKGGNEFEADMSAIKVTRENARAMAEMCDFGQSKIPTSFRYLKRMISKYPIVFMGGTIPGITTDADSMLAAEMLNAEKVVNISSIAYIYDKDPNKYKNAKRFNSMTHKQLLNLAIKNDMRKPGTHFLFDSVAAKIAYRSNIPLYFVNKKLKEIEKVLNGKRQKGTIVID